MSHGLFLFFFTTSKAQFVCFLPTHTSKHFSDSISFAPPNSNLKKTTKGETRALEQRGKGLKSFKLSMRFYFFSSKVFKHQQDSLF